MLKNYPFFFRHYFGFFKTRYLLIALIFLSVFISSCEWLEPPKRKYLSVPHITWQHLGWCGAACIQMWAYYEKSWPTQEEIADYIGWSHSDVYHIADGVTRFTSRYAFGSPFYGQDEAISAQVAAIRNEAPSISIINQGVHAAIVIGFEWTELSGGRPRADFIRFNDPARSHVEEITAWSWKNNYFNKNPASNMYEIVLSCPDYIFEGADGHDEFINRGGTYYGDPGDKEEPEEPMQ